MAAPLETQQFETPPAGGATISDLLATAFARYGGGFVTYGLAAVVLCAIPGAAVAIARAQHARFAIFAAVLSLSASLAYMLLTGLIAADAGHRVRPAHARDPRDRSPGRDAGRYRRRRARVRSLFVLPLVAAPCALAAVAAGAGDAQGLGALRTGWSLALGSFRRSVGLTATVELIGAAALARALRRASRRSPRAYARAPRWWSGARSSGRSRRSCSARSTAR